MTSIHSTDIQAQQAPTVHKDGPERVRQRMDELRKHHNESTDIYNKTQPLIDEQIHQETLKYLHSGQVNGTKTKSQKPRAPKRQRNQLNGTAPTGMLNNTASNPTANHTASTTTFSTPQQATLQTSPAITSPPNGISPIPTHQHQIQQSNLQVNLCPQPEHLQQMTSYQPNINQPQQQSMHMPPMQQQQPIFKYQTSDDIYQQQTHISMQHPHQHPYQPHQTQRIYQPQPIHQQQQAPPSHLPQQHPTHAQQREQSMQAPSHLHPQQQQLDQGHFMVQHHHHQHSQQQSQHFAQHLSQIPMQQQQHQRLNHTPFMSLPNDLDCTLQAGLECDVDSLIKHEMSVEGQLDFNHDLLLKLDNHYQPQHHYHLNHINNHHL